MSNNNIHFQSTKKKNETESNYIKDNFTFPTFFDME